ncbi:MAG: PAS-domain containing protein [Paraglaciecola polaris]|uniref:PAS domain-containing hybrid sensor histidine kinase/response regulator n=1 Tax=Paraglaciecola polaris TaxID=222814 RepID=UPI00300395ED|tara:strand:+ start:348 stop:3785 length:3438 start_codon:yes stop_codon:yes gene_type:complete
MALGWMVLAIIYLTGLFWVAKWGDSNSALAKRISSHPAIYSLALAIYCTAWTFFGSVGEASRDTWDYLPILLGPMLLYLFGYRFLRKLIAVSKRQHITTIADFISSRYGKRQTIALLVTLIALLATIPYIALQLKAVGSAFLMFSGQTHAELVVLGATTFIALFSIYFGTKHTDVTEYRRGLMVAISFESVIKLCALIAVATFGYLAYSQTSSAPLLGKFTTYEAMDNILSFSFVAQTLMAAGAVVCLPRQFHVAIVDNLKLSHLKTARWLFPLYLLCIAVLIPIISAAGDEMFRYTSQEPDTYVLGMAINSGSILLQMLVFVGGLSAATAMIIVATLTLSTMLTNDVILPNLLSEHRSANAPPNFTKRILLIRRLVIAGILFLAFLYYQQMTDSRSLASIGLIAFSLVIQLMPAIIGGLYWKRGHAQGVYAGLMVGIGSWILWLLLPLLNDSGQNLLLNDTINAVAIYSLLANTLAYMLFSYVADVRLIDRIQAEAFVTTTDDKSKQHNTPRTHTTVEDLQTLLSTFLGEKRCRQLLSDYQQRNGQILNPAESASEEFVLFSERALGGVIGASSAKALVDSAISGKKLNFEEVVNFFDDTTQAIQFNMSALVASLESLEQGISVIDRDLNLVAWNKSYLALFSYPANMIRVGRPIEDLVRYNAQRGECGSGEVEYLVHKRLEHMRKGTSHRFLRQRSDGRTLEMIGTPLPGGGFVTSFNDVTEHIETQHALKEANIDLENRIQKRTQEVQTINAELRSEIQRRAQAETQLVSARSTAEQANASKTRFLALASHDILQPLNAAKLYLGALQEAVLNDDARQTVGKLSNSIQASEALIATLLDIARLDQGELQPEPHATNVQDVLQPLVAEFELIAEQKGLQLRSRIPEIWVKTDRTYLYRIMQNFLSNALKYTESGGVLVSVRQRGDKVLFQVFDTGTGIEPQQLDKIFSDFYRVSGNQQQGVGLGLGVVQRLSAILQANLRVSSKLHHGSCFSIQLPLCEPLKAKPVMKVNKVGLHELKVLCVDDQMQNLDALQSLLVKWKVIAHCAQTPADALASLGDFTPDVILMDFQLSSDVDGLQLIALLRRQLAEQTPGQVPAILITANIETGLIERCQEQGCGYLSKPVKPAKLRALLQAAQAEVARQ